MNHPTAPRTRRQEPIRARAAALGLASLLVVHAASAAEGKGDTAGGKGGPAPVLTPSPGDDQPVDVDETTRLEQLKAAHGGIQSAEEDQEDPFAPKYKAWEVSVGFTTHASVYQNDLEGGAANKVASAFDGSIEYSITKHDHVTVSAFVSEQFLADAGESGWRFDDMLFAYGHDFSLPAKFKLGTGLSVTAPTSYFSQLEGEYTSLRLTLSLNRRFGPVGLGFRTWGTYDIQRYTSYDATQNGGLPTSLFNAGLAGNATLTMPFYDPVSLDLRAGTQYGWVHDVQGQLPATADQYFPNTQPVQQSYNIEASIRYELPALFGVRTDASFGYNDGPGLGYSSVLHEGIGHFYLGFRTASTLFLSISASY